MDCKFTTKLNETGQLPTTKVPNHHHTSLHSQPSDINPRLWQHQPFGAPPSLPIDDFHLTESPNKYSEDERQLRIKLAAVYRLIELNGWSMGIYNHVTVSCQII
jgi:hypothetical protein